MGVGGLILLDTHVALWWADDDPRLTARASRQIARSAAVLVSPISCWEIATLVRLGRIRLDRDVHVWIRDLVGGERVELLPLSAEAAASAGTLPGHFPGGPADRMLSAQAREHAVPLVTKDAAIRRHARAARDVRTVW